MDTNIILTFLFAFVAGIMFIVTLKDVTKWIKEKRNDTTDHDYCWFCDIPEDHMQLSDREALIYLERYLCKNTKIIHDIYENRQAELLNHYILDDVLTMYSNKHHNELRIRAKQSKKRLKNKS